MKSGLKLSAFAMVVLTACAWPLMTTVFDLPAPWGAVCLLVAGFILAVVACLGRFEDQPFSSRYLFLAPLPAIAALIIPWPLSIGLIVLALALLIGGIFRPARFWKAVCAGLALEGLILLVQGLALHPSLAVMSRCFSFSGIATPLAAFMRFFGADAASMGDSIAVVTLRETYRFPVGPGLLGFPTALLLLAGGLTAALYLAAPGRRLRAALIVLAAWIIYLPLRAVFCLLVFTHLQLYVGYFENNVRVDILWSPWWHLGTFLPLAAAWTLALRSRGDSAQRQPAFARIDKVPHLPLAAAALVGAALVVFAFAWYESGAPKAQRVVIDEGHSDWEKTTRAPGTRWYGILSMYNMFSLSDYMSYFYDLKRNEAPLDDDLLSRTDVLILKTPTRAYSPKEIDCVVRFVRRGGGLFVIGEHTNYLGCAVYLNSIINQLGLHLNEDCVFTLAGPIPYVELWKRPPLLYHPIVAHVPFQSFEVSCSVSPRSLCADAVMQPGGLFRLEADYFMENYYPYPRRTTAMFVGPFAQFATVQAGKGRVAAFTDSTQVSNFSDFYPGRSEMYLSTIDWLGRSHTNGYWRWAAALVGIALLLVPAARLLRVTDFPGACALLAGVLLLGAALALLVCRAHVDRAFPMPTPKVKPPIVAFLRQGCDYELPITDFVRDSEKSYDVFYEWVLRTRYFPQARETIDDAAGDDLLVIPNPSRPFTAHEIEGLTTRLAAGRSTLVMIRTKGDIAAAQSILKPFGMDTQQGLLIPGHPIDDAAGMPTGVMANALMISGATPTYRMSQMPVATEFSGGKGKLLVIGFGDIFRDPAMGYSNVTLPDAQLTARFKLEFQILQHLMPPESCLPAEVLKELREDTQWMSR